MLPLFYPCATPVLTLCYPVLPLCYPCATPVLPLCYPCATPVLPLCLPCASPVLLLGYPYATPGLSQASATPKPRPPPADPGAVWAVPVLLPCRPWPAPSPGQPLTRALDRASNSPPTRGLDRVSPSRRWLLRWPLQALTSTTASPHTKILGRWHQPGVNPSSADS